MESIIDQIVRILGFPTAFEIVFGLVISMVLFLIDRGEKKRQEEALRRQDESLDIILEQVSKVNVFQTKTLSLAIESLGNDFETFRNDIEQLRNSIQDANNFHTSETGATTEPDKNISDTKPYASLSPKSVNFGDVLSKQITSFVDQIKTNLSELTQSGKEQQKNIYKVKKGLEFDIKDLFNIQKMLNEIKSKEQFDEPKFSKEFSSKGNVEGQNQSNQSEDIENVDKTEVKENIFDKGRSNKIDFEDLNLQLENLDSISEIVKFTESIIKNFETKNNKSPVERKKVKPSKFISKEEFNQENQND